MNNQELESRLENLINSDRTASKQLALKTKHLYKRLHFLANAQDTMHQQMHEKEIQLMMAEKMLQEHRELLASLRESQANLRHQIVRSRKKVTDLKNQTNKSEPITKDDRYIYTKNALKKSLLGECLKIRFHEVKSHNRVTLMGYASSVDKLHPFQKKISIDSKQTENTATLWDYVKLGSKHIDEWNDLFTNDNALHKTI